MCNVYLAWYIYTAQWIWFGIYPGEPACKKTCGSVHPRLVGQLSDTISSPWNRPKISDSKSGLPKPARPPRRIRLLTMATSLLLSSAISAPIARRLLLLAGAKAPIRSPSLAYSGRAAPSLRRGFHVRSQQQQSGCTVRTLFFLHWTFWCWSDGMIGHKKKGCLDVILFVLRLLSICCSWYI